MSAAPRFDVTILGASGFGGGELYRLLLGHPGTNSLRGVARSAAGQPVARTHPHLAGLVDDVFLAEVDWERLAASPHPVLFAALPHGEFARLHEDLAATWTAHGLADRLTVIDLSGDFRLDDADSFRVAYGQPHPCPERLGDYIYGLSEVARESLRGAKRIACPGCFATAIELALLPLSDLVRELRPGFVAVTAVTGSSGSGLTPSATTHHPTRDGDFRAYKVLGHQHLSEIEMLLRREGFGGRIAFVPQSGPFVRGIHVTATFELPEGLSPAALESAYRARYPAGGFVRIVDEVPRLKSLVGSNRVELALKSDGRHAVVLLTLDNLMKGMAGQAVQNLNLASGWPETTGLRAAAAYP